MSTSTPLVEPVETSLRTVALGDLFVKRGSVNPARHEDESFDLFSVPAYERSLPDQLLGSAIGSSKVSVEPGDTLLCRIVPHIRRAWIVPPSSDNRQIASGEWIVLRHDEVDSAYLRHVLLGDPFHRAFMSTVAGVGGSLMRARPSHAAAIRIPLPTLPEQRRIAAILDQADELRAKRRRAVSLLDEVERALLPSMFGDPVVNPFEFERVMLGDVVTRFSDGPHVSPAYVEEGVPFLSMRHVRDGQLTFDDAKFISETDAHVHWRKCKPGRGDLVYTKGGTTGLAAVVETDDAFAVWVHLALLKPNRNLVDPSWLAAVLNSPYCYQQSQVLTRGIANRDLGLTRMPTIKLVLPPLALQEAFSQKVGKIRAIKRVEETHLTKLDELFASLQHRAFSGQL